MPDGGAAFHEFTALLLFAGIGAGADGGERADALRVTCAVFSMTQWRASVWSPSSASPLEVAGYGGTDAEACAEAWRLFRDRVTDVAVNASRRLHDAARESTHADAALAAARAVEAGE